MLQLDGSAGEGGGQILRSALTLSLLTKTPFEINNLRAARAKPGLRAQHLAAVKAAEAISAADVSGARMHASSLSFNPQGVSAGRFAFDIQTAGSTLLVLQTILLPLCYTGQTSEVTIRGGTHVPWSPCSEYIEWVWLTALEEIGFRAELRCERAGFYPRGGGEIHCTIDGRADPVPVTWERRGGIASLKILSGLANLPDHVVERQISRAYKHLEELGVPIENVLRKYDSNGKGSILLICPAFKQGHAAFFRLGKRGKPAEVVADEATGAFQAFVRAEAAVDPYLADQLLIPLSLCPGSSTIRTSEVTNHLLTNAAVLRAFGLAKVTIEGDQGQPGLIHVEPENRG